MHITSAPPVTGLNISVWCEQFGHTKPLIFSITPRIYVLVFKQNDISFLTSESDTSYGVVTTMAPSYGEDFKYYTIEICSSDVPGGVSIIKKSRSPQATSVKNYLIRPFFLGPLHIIASSY